MQIIFIVLLWTIVMNPAPTQFAALSQSRQMILVTTKDWNGVGGELRRYERDSVKSSWHQVGGKIPIVVGRNGMAWGRGLHGEASPQGGDGPIKKEGDGRSPAGIFRLSLAFGYAAAGSSKLPYVQATPALECVDDVKSAHYNRVLDRTSVERPDWSSSERMRRQDNQYRLGVVVDHNAERKAGCGSCIFLHIWAGASMGTAGCTAMEASKMEALLRWLDATRRPMLVQLPQAEFDRLQEAWGLPGS